MVYKYLRGKHLKCRSMPKFLNYNHHLSRPTMFSTERRPGEPWVIVTGHWVETKVGNGFIRQTTFKPEWNMNVRGDAHVGCGEVKTRSRKGLPRHGRTGCTFMSSLQVVWRT